ncbi:MAG TPA: inositol monophosphatase family protein [Trueperaceae bacterium]
MPENLRHYLDFATQLAYDAGRLTLGYYQTGLRPDFKPDDTPVTVADRKAEELIRARIEATYPKHGILGEEYGDSQPDASYRWIIDPIDGTKAFLRGVPLYAVLIALEIEGISEVGAAYFPALDEMIGAASRQGCYWNGRPARVSQARDLSRATLAYTDVAGFAKHGRQAAFERLAAACYDRRGWSDAYGYALVATGRVELMLDPVVSPWDCGPFPPILREAGGTFGDWKGHETIYANEALATTRDLLPEVLRIVEGE